MITSLYKRDRYGCNDNYSPSFGGHLRAADNRAGAADLVRSGLLDDVGAELGAGGNTSNLCNFQLPYGTNKGEKK